MDFPKCFKFVWWVFGILGLAAFLVVVRWDNWTGDTINYVDGVLIGVWLVLVLLPFFEEIRLPGISVKKEIKELRDSTEAKLGTLQQAILSIQTTIVLPPLPTRPALAEVERELVAEEIAASPKKVSALQTVQREEKEALDTIDDTTKMAFDARYRLEKIVTRLWQAQFGDFHEEKYNPLTKKIDDLMKAEVLYSGIANAAKELWSICSHIIHGQGVSNEHAEFVRKYSHSILEQMNQFKANIW